MLAFKRLAGQGHPGHVALTFDDGPDPGSTPEFTRVLAERGVHATFFMLGSMVAKAPGLAAEIAAAGHEIGVHGFEHRYLPARTPQATMSDLTRAAELIAKVTGTWPRLFRPPYGVLSGPALLAARRLGLTPVLWGAWGREWTAGATSASVLQTLLGQLDGGVTVLLHDSGCTSPPGCMASRPWGGPAATRRVRAARAGCRASRRAWRHLRTGDGPRRLAALFLARPYQ